MALPLAKAAPLKPGIKLAQALSEFEAVLPDDQKTELRTYRGQSPPNSTDVIRFTAEIDRDAGRNRKSRQCVGTRLTNVLQAVQQFASIADFIVGSSQSQIACAIWGAVRISLQLVSAISSYFDQLTTLFMTIGVTSPRYQDFELLYPDSTRLQSALCEYFIVIVHLCTRAVLFLKKPFWTQLSSSILKPFESEFGGFQRDLENLAKTIQGEVSLASNQAQQNEAQEMSKFRSVAKSFSTTMTREFEEARRRKSKKAVLKFLNACSLYNHEKSWKQARKRGNTNWILDNEGYKQWKEQKVSSTLWCTGILGSGKTVLTANVVEDLKITTPAVSYFFCRHDEAKSLKTRTIIGSVARQIFDYIKSDIIDALSEIRPDIMDTDQILTYLQELLPSNSRKHFIVIDGLDECEEKERLSLLQCLKQLLMSKSVFQVYCSSRPDVFLWAHTVLEPQWNVSMPQTNADIEEYVEDTLVNRLESKSLSVGDPTIILTVRKALLNNAHGMFLWVAFQIDSICSQKTDEAILSALEDLPKDLPETFNRILRKLEHSTAADPQFCRKVFDLVAAAQRPLTLGELCEASSVNPGETSWDASKLVNDVLKSLLDSCGSLIAVDEEHQTVSFTHQSVKQHLLSKPTDSDMEKYHIHIKDADLYLGCIIVTYLNLEIFSRQLVKANSPMLPQAKNYPSIILGGSLPRSNIANRLAVRLLKSRGSSRSLDIHSQLKTAVGIVGEDEQAQPAHPFLSYAQEYWLFHTKTFKSARAPEYQLWKLLIGGHVNTIEAPWAPEKLYYFDDEFVEWIIQNEHWALIDRSLVYVRENLEIDIYESLDQERLVKIISPVLKFLEKRATDMTTQNMNFDAALYLASSQNNEAVMLLSLKNGANVNAEGGYYGTALQATVASMRFIDNEDTVRLLLENGANVNVEGGYYGTALHAASFYGDKEMVRLLLEKGANVNVEGGFYGTALQAASVFRNEEMVRLLLEKGADVNVEGGGYGTALQAASVSGDEEIVRLLLEKGANVNVEGGPWGTALQAASVSGDEETVRLLLENGATATNNALEKASSSAAKKLIRKALDSQLSALGSSRFGPMVQSRPPGEHSLAAHGSVQ